MRVNVLKTKVMVSGKDMVSLKDSGKFPCGVCRKGVRSNSILCVGCSNRIHKKYSKIWTLVPDLNFRCNRSKGLVRPIISNANKEFQFSNGADFCFSLTIYIYTYIRPLLLYASEIWAPTVSNIAKLQRNDRCMTWWICNIKLSDNISSSSILEKLGIADINISI